VTTDLPEPADLDAITDPVERSRAYLAAMDTARRVYADGRRRALAAAVQQLGSKKAVAEALGITPAAVGKALNARAGTEETRP
jgi:poly-gamma-glutamate capsule biosynthesis protein CapA/YwtB (metallophosphatase superfamily)